MKTIPGTIRITDKVYFEPDGLKKPKDYGFDVRAFWMAIRDWIASEKLLVEVENVYFHKHLRTWMFREHISHKILVKNNQNCKAEIKDNKATIIELIK